MSSNGPSSPGNRVFMVCVDPVVKELGQIIPCIVNGRKAPFLARVWKSCSVFLSVFEERMVLQQRWISNLLCLCLTLKGRG